jgi:acetate kinase
MTEPTAPPPPGAIDVLVLNSGSSSVKYSAYRLGDGVPTLLLTGDETAVGAPEEAAELLRAIGRRLTAAGIVIHAVGHRIVHGGPVVRHHCVIDDVVFNRLQAAAAFAPLHAAPALSLIRVAQNQFPGVAQIACLDTSFHLSMPPVAATLPVARELRDSGIRRYGFHGLSCESIVRQLGAELPARLVIAHLGNGCSITAVRQGRSIDTSMGLTPSGGVIMGTRSGDIDPGLLIYLIRERGFDATTLETLIDRHSGLAGISGVSSDMRQLHATADSNIDAQLAVAMFVASVQKGLAGMTSALGGVDLIVFTGGMGEHDATLRAAIGHSLGWLGVEIDPVRNQTAVSVISSVDSPVPVRVLPSQENQQIARHVGVLLQPDRRYP